MKTLLDIERENAVIRKEREKNIEMLTKKRDEAKLLLSLISVNSYEENQQRQKVGAEIDRLNNFIKSEQEAISLLSQINIDEVDIDYLIHS